MTEDVKTIQVDGKTVSRKLDAEEVNDIVQEIIFQHGLEVDFLTKSKATEDEELINAHREDAYMANLIKIRQAKRLTRAQFVEYEVDRCTCCAYSQLNIPEWEDYNN